MELHHYSRVSTDTIQACDVTTLRADLSVSSASRAEREKRMARHQHDSASMPPIRRGSMSVRPWRGFWKSLGERFVSGLVGGGASINPVDIRIEPWQYAATVRRLVFVVLIVFGTAFATRLFANLQPEYNDAWLQYGQLVLFAVLSCWVISGFVTAVMGFYVLLCGDKHGLSARAVRQVPLRPGRRTAIIVPICNEEVATVFAGLRAICESIVNTGYAQAFDLFVLSDSYDAETMAVERQAWCGLRAVVSPNGGENSINVYYRLRSRRLGHKAGNVADFCRRWGKNYEYMVVLDADSVMSGSCLANLVKLMDANPKAGIIQTNTQAIGHVSLHARAQQFASRVTGRLFTLGMQYWQLGESHYWGHNAIIRIKPFMQHCALARIKGKGGMAGGILSHDFVEAALMRRAGYHVWLVSDLMGSYEQQPADLLSERQRDRRWGQGNLQNARIMTEAGLHPVHRAMFVTGTFSYLSAPLWLMFMSLGYLLWFSGGDGVLGQGFFRVLSHELLGLWVWTICILFIPRLLGVAAVFLRREQHLYGGGMAVLGSTLLETTLAILLAPIRMIGHTLFVVTAITGLGIKWKSPPREAYAVSWRDAFWQFAPFSVAAAGLGVYLAMNNISAMVWLFPVMLPLCLAMPLTVLSSQMRLGSMLRRKGLLLIPEESCSPMVLRRAWHHASMMLPVAPLPALHTALPAAA